MEVPQPSTSRPKRSRKLNSQIYRDDYVTTHSEKQKRSEKTQSVQATSNPNSDDNFSESEKEPSENEDTFLFDLDESDENEEIDENNETIHFVEPDDTYNPDNNEPEISIPNPQTPQYLYTGFHKIEWKHLSIDGDLSSYLII